MVFISDRDCYGGDEIGLATPIGNGAGVKRASSPSPVRTFAGIERLSEPPHTDGRVFGWSRGYFPGAFNGALAHVLHQMSWHLTLLAIRKAQSQGKHPERPIGC